LQNFLQQAMRLPWAQYRWHRSSWEDCGDSRDLNKKCVRKYFGPGQIQEDQADDVTSWIWVPFGWQN